ncbi:hypothetical protein ACFYPA_06425 [Streptomyces sp. NPDC005775]|uniref:hypothetical protein n=1 Tax=Streptomyces sp. NPDC005775 TaxID=3364729 RepID=UPI0036930C4C
MSTRDHGTNAKYHLEKCRCYPCCHAASEYDRNRRRAIAYGRWQPFVDAAPVRAHVRELGEFGIGWIRAARLAGVATGGVSKLLYGDKPRGLEPTKRMRPHIALALLAVEPTLDNMGNRVPIDGTGTRRRLQALVAKGWTQSELARRLDMDRTNFPRTLTSDLVRVATVRAVNALYDELWRADPTDHGVPAHRAEAARRKAIKNGWAPVGAWDDDQIDDPAAHPDWTGRCGTTEGYSAHYPLGVPVCEPCRQARAEHRAQLKTPQAA